MTYVVRAEWMRERRGQERIAGLPGVIGYDERSEYSNDEEGG